MPIGLSSTAARWRRRDAVARAARRTGLSECRCGSLSNNVPPALVPIADTVALPYRLKAQSHSLYCLSNMHFASIEYLERSHTFWEVFSGKVISCRVRRCKPEAKIYAHLLESYKLDAAETVFVDDVESIWPPHGNSVFGRSGSRVQRNALANSGP